MPMRAKRNDADYLSSQRTWTAVDAAQCSQSEDDSEEFDDDAPSDVASPLARVERACAIISLCAVGENWEAVARHVDALQEELALYKAGGGGRSGVPAVYVDTMLELIETLDYVPVAHEGVLSQAARRPEDEDEEERARLRNKLTLLLVRHDEPAEDAVSDWSASASDWSSSAGASPRDRDQEWAFVSDSDEPPSDGELPDRGAGARQPWLEELEKSVRRVELLAALGYNGPVASGRLKPVMPTPVEEEEKVMPKRVDYAQLPWLEQLERTISRRVATRASLLTELLCVGVDAPYPAVATRSKHPLPWLAEFQERYGAQALLSTDDQRRIDRELTEPSAPSTSERSPPRVHSEYQSVSESFEVLSDSPRPGTPLPFLAELLERVREPASDGCPRWLTELDERDIRVDIRHRLQRRSATREQTRRDKADLISDGFLGAHAVETVSASSVWVAPELLRLQLDATTISLSHWLTANDDKTSSTEVYAGTYGSMPVAVKRLTAVGRTAENAMALAAMCTSTHGLCHSNLVALVGVSWSKTALDVQVVMPLAHGDLRSLLATDAAAVELTWANAKCVCAIDVASALAYLHDHPSHKTTGIGGLTSRKVLLDADGTARLNLLRLPRRDLGSGSQSIRWVAPEVILGGAPTASSDVYAFGVLLTELDTAKVPFHDAVNPNGKPMEDMLLAFRVARRGLRPTLSSECPDAIVRLVEQCLEQDPAQRPSAQRLVYELRAILKHEL